MRQLTHDEIEWVVGRVMEYVDLAGGQVSAPDVSHSSLLYRLLSGKEALDIAPPLSYSRPNYTLGEGRPAVVECFVDEEHNMAACDQCRYKIVRKENETTFLLEYEKTGQRFRLSRQPVYNVQERNDDGTPFVITKGNGILILADADLP